MKVTSTFTDVQREINKILVRRLNTIGETAIDQIASEVKDLAHTTFINSEIYNRLINGDLRGHFGLPAASASDLVNEVIREAVNLLEIQYHPIKLIGTGQITGGGLQVGVTYDMIHKLLLTRAGSINIEKGVLPWLEWLLVRGDQVLVFGYGIVLKNAGRSELGVMAKGESLSWRVPPDVAGTEENNWITRELRGQFLNQVGEIATRYYINAF